MKKTTSGGTLTALYWYDTSGNVLDETDGGGSTSNTSFNGYVFFDGSRIARRDSSSNVSYYFDDHLGTSREIVQSGSTTPCYDADFYPFGWPYLTGSSSNHFCNNICCAPFMLPKLNPNPIDGSERATAPLAIRIVPSYLT